MVSADNAETLPGCNGNLDQAGTVGPPITNNVAVDENIHISGPIPISNEGLGATTNVVVTEPSFRKEDKGPP